VLFSANILLMKRCLVGENNGTNSSKNERNYAVFNDSGVYVSCTYGKVRVTEHVPVEVLIDLLQREGYKVSK